MLATREFADAVRNEENYWISNGIGGVPAMIFDQTHLVTGAQGVANYTAILKNIAGNRPA